MVEVISNCHTYFGRLNRKGDAVSMFEGFKANTVTSAKAKNMSEEELKGKHIIGTLFEDNVRTEFCDEYQRVVDSLRNK